MLVYEMPHIYQLEKQKDVSYLLYQCNYTIIYYTVILIHVVGLEIIDTSMPYLLWLSPVSLQEGLPKALTGYCCVTYIRT